MNRQGILIEAHKADLTETLHSVKQDFRQRIDHVDEYCKGNLDAVEKTMARVERMARENVNKKEAELHEVFEAAMAKSEALMLDT